MLEDAQAPILLTRASLEAILPSHWGRVIFTLMGSGHGLPSMRRARRSPGAAAQIRLYVIYTLRSQRGSRKACR